MGVDDNAPPLTAQPDSWAKPGATGLPPVHTWDLAGMPGLSSRLRLVVVILQLAFPASASEVSAPKGGQQNLMVP